VDANSINSPDACSRSASSFPYLSLFVATIMKGPDIACHRFSVRIICQTFSVRRTHTRPRTMELKMRAASRLYLAAARGVCASVIELRRFIASDR